VPRVALTEGEISAFRERICDAATRLFAEQGYEAVTLRAIAAAVGCSPMTPYRYFSNKDEIFTLVRAEAFRRFAEHTEAVAERIEDPVPRLAALGRAYIDFALSEPDSYRIMFELRQGDAAEHPELLSVGLRSWWPIREAVADAVDAGVLRGDPDTLAHLAWAGVHGLVSLELAGKLRLGRELRALVDPMMDTFFRGNVAASHAAKEVTR
jgi:AcrR family transcriptional regulator